MWGLGAKPLAEYEAEPHSAQADKVQIVVSKAYRSQVSDKSDIGELNLHRFAILLHNVKSAKSVAILRRNKLSRIFVGAGALDSPLGGVSRFGFFTKLSGGTKRANDVRPYRCVAVVLSVFYIQFSSYIRGATLGIMPLVAYTQNLQRTPTS